VDIGSLVPAVDVGGFAGCALRTFVSFLVGKARVGGGIVVGASECLWEGTVTTVRRTIL
jgi:hypothetical protein